MCQPSCPEVGLMNLELFWTRSKQRRESFASKATDIRASAEGEHLWINRLSFLRPYSERSRLQLRERSTWILRITPFGILRLPVPKQADIPTDQSHHQNNSGNLSERKCSWTRDADRLVGERDRVTCCWLGENNENGTDPNTWHTLPTKPNTKAGSETYRNSEARGQETKNTYSTQTHTELTWTWRYRSQQCSSHEDFLRVLHECEARFELVLLPLLLSLPILEAAT